MRWEEVRAGYPDQWLIVEALEAHTTADSRRQLDHLAVLERCSDGQAAMAGCRRLHREYPQRELYFVHTSREELDIEERRWIGIRGVLAPSEASPRAGEKERDVGTAGQKVTQWCPP